MCSLTGLKPSGMGFLVRSIGRMLTQCLWITLKTLHVHSVTNLFSKDPDQNIVLS